MAYLPIGPQNKAMAVPFTRATDESDFPVQQTAPSVSAMTKYTPATTAYVKHTPFMDTVMCHIRPVVTTEDLVVASVIVHKIADTNAIAATNPAVTEANSYALVNELKADYNVHIADLAYHVAADAGTCSLADADDEAKLIALANNLRTLMATHAANTSAHGSIADAVFLAAVTATTVASSAATAITLENALATAWLAHIAVVDLATYITYPAAGMPVEWPCNGPFFAKTNVSGHSFVVAEFLVP
jgi:hypothetical protein